MPEWLAALQIPEQQFRVPVSLTRQSQLTSLELWGSQSLERADRYKVCTLHDFGSICNASLTWPKAC